MAEHVISVRHTAVYSVVLPAFQSQVIRIAKSDTRDWPGEVDGMAGWELLSQGFQYVLLLWTLRMKMDFTSFVCKGGAQEPSPSSILLLEPAPATNFCV